MAFVSRRAIAQAQNFAASERADPFAFSRAMSHMKAGIARDGDYSAEAHKETRYLDGKPYSVTVYKNTKRM